jgi:transcription antitermination factor NusG
VTHPRHEKRVALFFEQRGIEHFLPLYRSARKWRNGQKGATELPLFPCYIFVQVARAERVSVLQVPGVRSIVCGAAGEMAPLPADEVEIMRAGLHLRQAEPYPLLQVGQRVRIKSGPLSGMVGILVRKNNACRAVLTMDLIMQSMAVEVDEEELEPVVTQSENIATASRLSCQNIALGEGY